MVLEKAKSCGTQYLQYLPRSQSTYVGIYRATKEAVWLRSFRSELGICMTTMNH